MAYANRKTTQEIELWNVSLLPLVRVTPSPAPPPDPAPLGGRTLHLGAVLSVAENASAAPLAQAA